MNRRAFMYGTAMLALASGASRGRNLPALPRGALGPLEFMVSRPVWELIKGTPLARGDAPYREWPTTPLGADARYTIHAAPSSAMGGDRFILNGKEVDQDRVTINGNRYEVRRDSADFGEPRFG